MLVMCNRADQFMLLNQLYKYPIYNESQNKQYFITLLPKQVKSGVYATLEIKDVDDAVLFQQKIVEEVVYNIEKIQITFNIIKIDIDSVNGKSDHTIIEGGIRLK